MSPSPSTSVRRARVRYLLTEAELCDAVAAGDVGAGLPAPQRQDLRPKVAYEQQVAQAVAAVQSEVRVLDLAQPLQVRSGW